MKETKASMVKAIKGHTCSYCGGAIKSGERYVRWISIANNVKVNKLHPDCESVRRLEMEIGGGK